MKFTQSWLLKHLDSNASLEELGERLTAIGLELEECEDKAALYAPFKAAYVESAEQHPDADRLKICSVKTADQGSVQVVCGAPNAKTGMMGIFAPEGSYIPGTDITLKKGKIRGAESCGMLVSEKEMQLSEDHKGIIELPSDIKIGTPLSDIYPVGDVVFDIALTPNRADCAGIRGIARDLAAAGLGKLKDIDTSPVKGSFSSKTGVLIEDKEGCPEFLGRSIKGVKNGPSPDWLQNLLKAVGLRPISALVDITNLMTLEFGRPLHAYDEDKLQGDIVVKKAVKGEKFDALNDKSYETNGGETAITDSSGLIGLGGIVGGTSTGCDEATTQVFLESAYFTPQAIARTGRDLGIESDARYRFERGVDPEFTLSGIEIATRLILEICGGEPSEIVAAGSTPSWKREIEYNTSEVKKLAGFDVDAKTQIKILESLGFTLAAQKAQPENSFLIEPPSWRGDVFGKADIVEEVIRIVGFENIPELSVSSDSAVPSSAETQNLTYTRLARTALSSRGMNECVTWSFMSKDLALEFVSNDNADNQAHFENLTLSNPISSELNQMRPSILPNLIEAAGRNADKGFANAALCEIGPTFKSLKTNGQANVATGIRAGHFGDKHWSDANAARDVDVFDAKADAISVLKACGAPIDGAQIQANAFEYFHPGRSGTLQLGKNILAQFGEIHPAILEKMNIKTPVVGFEVFLDNIPQPKQKQKTTAKKMLELAPLQAVQRDFAFIVEENTPAQDIIRAAKSADKDLIVDAFVFDVYQGKGVESGKKSIALNITLQPKEQSLTDKELEEITKKVIAVVSEKTGGTLRA